jgi:hypothetical protein
MPEIHQSAIDSGVRFERNWCQELRVEVLDLTRTANEAAIGREPCQSLVDRLAMLNATDVVSRQTARLFKTAQGRDTRESQLRRTRATGSMRIDGVSSKSCQVRRTCPTMPS